MRVLLPLLVVLRLVLALSISRGKFVSFIATNNLSHASTRIPGLPGTHSRLVVYELFQLAPLKDDVGADPFAGHEPNCATVHWRTSLYFASSF